MAKCSDRKQNVHKGEFSSLLEGTTHAVPQGSTFGLMLFNIYINDLGFLPFKAKLYQYADDRALVLCQTNYTDAAEILQEDVDSLINWFQRTLYS